MKYCAEKNNTNKNQQLLEPFPWIYTGHLNSEKFAQEAVQVVYVLAMLKQAELFETHAYNILFPLEENNNKMLILCEE